MAMTKYVGYIELETGEEIGPFRVGLKTKIQAGKTSKARGWQQERDAAEISAFMAWHAAKSKGLIDMPWEEFIDATVDSSVEELTADEAEADQDDPENPTTPTHSVG